MNIRHSVWRDAARPLRILGIDARAFFPLLMWLYHPRKWTFAAGMIAILGFFLMEKKGLTLPVLLRAIRHRLRGTVIVARYGPNRSRFE
ncbi:TraK-IcmT (modular protein) [Candidatus Glomeribacter gigasporarum BEG34]|uniref:TraK-IcmT (Modular protein) n=1 Tax=Candidatus Glomeribacter gigasporarum BEG34 TaxID=1070319 RepID=G2J831_9BURK|nr:IcmT/TraK family protein [Candidatus Glomeribacter gigasporarum]CCD28928.1 TraK-IcmT (modular protein) [Candidatus Glomeribacter gigasporarum BEG34]